MNLVHVPAFERRLGRDAHDGERRNEANADERRRRRASSVLAVAPRAGGVAPLTDDAVRVSSERSPGEMRRAKSLRIGVHNANAVVWEPVRSLGRDRSSARPPRLRPKLIKAPARPSRRSSRQGHELLTGLQPHHDRAEGASRADVATAVMPGSARP